MKRFTAFTLSELMVVFALLGLMSAILVPKIFNDSVNNRDGKLMKSTILALGHMTENVFMMGREANLLTLAPDRMAVSRTCTNATAQGCWNTSTQGALTGVANTAVVLKNGAVIAGLTNVTNSDEALDILIDTNGTGKPNRLGVDQIRLTTCSTDQVASTSCLNPTFAAFATNGYKVEPGKLLPDDATSTTYFNELTARQ